jgi:hypothetical protein
VNITCGWCVSALNDVLQVYACLQHDCIRRVLPANVLPLGERWRNPRAFIEGKNCRFGRRKIHSRRPPCLKVWFKTFSLFSADFFCSYQIGYNVLHAANYGAPQVRKRVLFVAARQGVPLPDFPIPTHVFPHARVQRVKLPTGAYLAPVSRFKYGDSNTDLSAPLHFVTIHEAIGDLVWSRSRHFDNSFTSAYFAASVRLVCIVVPKLGNLAYSNSHLGLTHTPRSRKLLLTERRNASAKTSLGSRLFQRCVLQELQQIRMLDTRNHVNILVGHYPVTRSSCDWGAKSFSTIIPNASTIILLNGTFLVFVLDWFLTETRIQNCKRASKSGS